MISELTIRKLHQDDVKAIPLAFKAQGWTDKKSALYKHYIDQQSAGVFDILVAEWEGDFAGYVLVCWESEFSDFKERNIPEIRDFNVLKKYQRKGIGTALMDEAERRVARISDKVGLAFGAMKDYGAAQILYIRRGYIPWGDGLTVSGRILKYGEMVKVDHSLMFYLSKELR